METKQSQTSPAARENIMGTMEINPLLVKLSVPMMISMLVQALYNVVDSVFVSHVSESALTAVSLAFSLQNVMIAVGVGTGVGVNALLSKSLGEKNQHRANVTAENGIFLSLCSFVVFLVIGLTCMKPYFYAQTSDAAIAQQGIQYLSVCCIFSLGLFTQTMGEKLLAATGRTQLSMISQLVGAVVNIILDPIFIFGYCGQALSGTTGAAVATVIGQFCGAGMTLFFNLNKNPDIQISFKGFRPSAKAIGRIYTVGLPSIAMQCVGSLMTFGMNLILMAFSATADFCEDYNYPLQFNFRDACYAYCEYEYLHRGYRQMNSIGLDCMDGEDQDRHLIDMPHAAFAAVPPERVADFDAKYGHLGLHWMQTGAKNADGLCYYDIVRGGIDKGMGLSDLCEKMGLTLADAVAAGDSANDVGMLKAAGLGCCMANGTPDAKAAADRIIGDVREDGVAALIEELWFDGPTAVPSGRDLGSPWDKIESAGGQ